MKQKDGKQAAWNEVNTLAVGDVVRIQIVTTVLHGRISATEVQVTDPLRITRISKDKEGHLFASVESTR